MSKEEILETVKSQKGILFATPAIVHRVMYVPLFLHLFNLFSLPLSLSLSHTPLYILIFFFLRYRGRNIIAKNKEVTDVDARGYFPVEVSFPSFLRLVLSFSLLTSPHPFLTFLLVVDHVTYGG